MRKFLTTFIFIQVVLIIYIFNTSVMNIYEKNNVINKELQGYRADANDLGQVEKFYDEIISKYENYEFVVIKNTVSTTDENIYEIYTTPNKIHNQKKTYSKNVTYVYKKLTKNDWLDSIGMFYTDIPMNKIWQLSEKYNLNIAIKSSDNINYEQILKLFGYNFALLVIVTQIVYCIFISYNLKEIGIKISMGFSTIKIFKKYFKLLTKIFILSIMLTMIPYGIYLAILNRLTTEYMILISIYFACILIINLLLFYNGSFILSLVNLDLMIKNKTFNKYSNIVIQTIKIIFTFLIVFSSITLISEYQDYKKVNEDVLRYKELQDYYTGNGYYAEEYDSMERDKDKFLDLANNVKELYNKEDGLFCDIAYLSSYLKGRAGIEYNFAIINANYLDKFSDLSKALPNINLHDLPNDTVLVPEKFMNNKDKCLAFLKKVIELNYNYRTGSQHKVDEFNIVYIPNTKVKVNTNSGFEVIDMPFVYLDNGNLNGAYYMDQFSNSKIIFEYKSLETFDNKLASYKLDSLIGAGTLLTPYLNRIENTLFKLKTLSIFSILFTITLAFIIYISNYISINVNKKKYVYKEILGFSHFNIIKSNILVSACLVILGIVMSIIDIKLTIFIGIVLIDLFVYELLYRTIIDNKLYEIVKGA